LFYFRYQITQDLTLRAQRLLYVHSLATANAKGACVRYALSSLMVPFYVFISGGVT